VDETIRNPDPDGKVHRDADKLIQSEVTVVPGQVAGARRIGYRNRKRQTLWPP
jgi:hypothetical protein